MSSPILTSVPAWLALPELEIKETSRADEEGSYYQVVRVGQLFARVSLCHAAGIVDPPLEQGGDRVVLPTVTISLPEDECMLRLPLDLGGWAFDIAGLAQVAGVRLVPQRFQFRKYAGRYAAGAARGEEYAVRSWLRRQN